MRRWLYWIIWLRLPIWRAERITVISERTLGETLSYVNADQPKFVTIPCCLPLSIKATPKAFLVTKPHFLLVGTKPNKNLSRIMAALREMPCRLVVVGRLSASERKLSADYGLDVQNHVEVVYWQRTLG